MASHCTLSRSPGPHPASHTTTAILVYLLRARQRRTSSRLSFSLPLASLFNVVALRKTLSVQPGVFLSSVILARFLGVASRPVTIYKGQATTINKHTHNGNAVRHHRNHHRLQPTMMTTTTTGRNRTDNCALPRVCVNSSSVCPTYAGNLAEFLRPLDFLSDHERGQQPIGGTVSCKCDSQINQSIINNLPSPCRPSSLGWCSLLP